jgi:hypothetical protein
LTTCLLLLAASSSLIYRESSSSSILWLFNDFRRDFVTLCGKSPEFP